MKPLRVLIVGAWNHRGRHEELIARAFRRIGAQVRGLNPSRHQSLYHRGPRLFPFLLERMVRGFRPHLLLTSKGKGVPPDLWASLPGIKVVWYTDYRDPPDPHIVALARVSDRFFLTAYGQIPKYQSLGLSNVEFLPQGVDPSMCPLRPAVLRHLISFFGSGYAYRHRWEILTALAERYTLSIWGTNWARYDCPFDGSRCLRPEEWEAQRQRLPRPHPPVYNEDLGQKIAETAIVLGIGVPGVPLYFSNRVWLTLGWGGFLLQEYVEGLEHFFENHRHLVWYRDVEEAVDLIAWYLAHPGPRERIALQGYQQVQRFHTYDQRIQVLLQSVGLWPEVSGS